MAKIDRYDGNVEAFASQATTNKRATFGTANTGDDTLDGNVTSDFLTGWEIVGPSDEPTLQDFNALGFTLSQFLAYLHQSGVPEWNGSQEYQVDSYVNRNGSLYVCQTADHVSVTPPESDGANWEKDATAARTSYDPSGSSLSATDVKEALDEVDGKVQPATESQAGIVEKATTAEAEAGAVDKFPDAAGVSANFDANEQQVGVGQTWQDLTASRTSSVTYTNTSGKPIYLSINCDSASDVSLTIDGNVDVVRQFSSGSGDGPNVSAIIQDNSTYELIVSGGNIFNWWELR